MLARFVVVRSASHLRQHKKPQQRQLATGPTAAAKPPPNVPLNAPDGPTAEDMERFNMARFASLSFGDQMAEFKNVMLRQDVRRADFFFRFAWRRLRSPSWTWEAIFPVLDASFY